MAELKVEIDPAEAGFDAARLARIDPHFARYVDDGRLPGWLLTVSRGGHIVHLSTYGQRDKEAGLPVELDTLFRIYSMTKPITSVAAMMLYEEGGFELKDPVSRFIPSFKDARVYTGGSALAPVTEPATEPVRIWHLLTHTAGLTYGFHHVHPVDAIYRAAGYEWGSPPGKNLAECCDDWAALPLVFQPGSEWNYGVNTDVLGRVVEVVSGQSLDEFFRTRIFEPLGMSETGFFVKASIDTGSPRCTSLNPTPVKRFASTPWEQSRRASRRSCQVGEGWSRLRPTTTGSPRCCCTAASSTVCGSWARARCGT